MAAAFRVACGQTVTSLDDFAEDERARRKPRDTIGKLADLLERSGIDVADVARINRVNVWQAMSKGDDGEPVVTDLTGIQLVPAWADGPEWPVVQPAKPTTVRPVKLPPKSAAAARTWVILPDPQIGYRRFEDGTLDPFHDEDAFDVALQIVRLVRPDGIVNLGDTLDAAEWSSRFAVQPEFVGTTQATLDRTHRFLAEQRANAGDDCEIVLLEGNHDDRLAKLILQNAKAALRLRPACTPPDTWPVLSVPYLLRLADLSVTYVGGYPAGRFEIAPGNDEQPGLWAIHGEKLDMAKVAKGERQSYVQGHGHHIQDRYETYEVAGEPVTVQAWMPGCLCRTDGAVPSTKGGVDAFGRHVRRIESWQQGVGVVSVAPDGSWAKEIVHIDRGRAVFRGQCIVANKTVQ